MFFSVLRAALIAQAACCSELGYHSAMVPAEIVSAAEDCAGDDVFFQRIREWLDSGGDVNDSGGNSWHRQDLCLLSRSNHPHLTKFLLERGADVNCVSESGMTPLYYSCGIPNRGGTDIINMLLDAGANIDAKTTEAVGAVAIAGETALSTSLDWFRHEDAKTALRYVTLLLRRGASLDDCWGGMPAEECLLLAATATQDFQPRVDLRGTAAGLGLHNSRGANGLLARWCVRRPGRPESPWVLDAARRAVLGPTHPKHPRPTEPARSPYRVCRPLGPQRDRGPRGAQRGCGAEGGRACSALRLLGL